MARAAAVMTSPRSRCCKRLAVKADVVVENFRPDVKEEARHRL